MTKIIREIKRETNVTQTTSGLATYNGGPLWQTGYKWINIFWGSFWNAPKDFTTAQVDKAVADIATDHSYWGGLQEYGASGGDMGYGVFGNSYIISQDPPTTIDDSAIGPQIKQWVVSGTVADVNEKGAYNIFFPPGVTITLQGSSSCSVFCDFHNFYNDGTKNYYYTVEPYPCTLGCNQCTVSAFDTLTQGLSEEMCILPEEILLGDNKPISEYEIGDKIVGMSGLDTVIAKFNRQYDGELISIKAHGMLPIICTPNHPILTIGGITPTNHSKPISYSTPEWKHAELLKEKHTNISGNYLLLPIIEGDIEVKEISLEKYFENTALLKALTITGTTTQFPLNEDTAWFLGLYVAEGSANFNDVTLALHEKEIDIANKVKLLLNSLGYRVTISPIKNTHAIRVYIGSRHLSSFLEEFCGKGALHKKIPDFILYHKNLSLVRAFLNGYIDGDGCRYVTRKKYKQIIVETVSKVLALQLQLAFARLGQFLALRKGKKGKEQYIMGRLCHTHDSYQGLLSNTSKVKKVDKYLISPILSIKRIPYKGQVRNVETTTHTYLVSNAIVHNCELATDMQPGYGWVIGNEEICDYCDSHFVCHQINSGEYVNAWYSGKYNTCWTPNWPPSSPSPPPPSTCPIAKIFTGTYNTFAKLLHRKTRLFAVVPDDVKNEIEKDDDCDCNK